MWRVKSSRGGLTASRLGTLAGALVLAGLASLPLGAAAQVAAPLPLEVEGPISAISKNDDGTATVTVFGRAFVVPADAHIHTPTKTIGIDDLTNNAYFFPGRIQPGFVGGTAIMIGESDASGVATIQDVFVEPAENVFLGVITKDMMTDGVIEMQGVPIEELPADSPIPSEGFHNGFGFQVKKETVPKGTGAAAEGYFAGGKLHVFLVETTAGDLFKEGPQTAVTRARCDPGGRLEVQVASYMPAAAQIEIRNATSNFLFGTATTVPDLEDPRFGVFRYRTDVSNEPVDQDGACPSEVKVVNLTEPLRDPLGVATNVATASVDGVTAPPPLPTTNFPPVAVDDTAQTFTNLQTNVELLSNDTDLNGNNTINPGSVQIINNSAMQVVYNGDGTVNVSAAEPGTYTFQYQVSDTAGLLSNLATVTVEVTQQAITDVVDVSRANFREGENRWNVRGTSTRPDVTMTLTLARTGATIGTARADATGFWALDVRGSSVVAINGDQVVATSSAGGTDSMTVTIVRR